MYEPLPDNLLQHVHPQLYFPYFGSLKTATHATFGINCGPLEAEHGSLGDLRTWNVSMSRQDTDEIIKDPSLTDRPNYYFRHGENNTPDGLGHPHPDRFWSFFNCGTTPDQNPFHRQHYYSRGLVHIDAVPWATILRWSYLPFAIQAQLSDLSMPVFKQTLERAKKLRKIVVRGQTAADFLEACRPELRLEWKSSLARPVFQFGYGHLKPSSNRTIEVIAVSQFHNLPRDVAPELLKLLSNTHAFG